ncbi:hypothetical protein KHQ08_08870 [Pseudochrobactrum algeriensis]|uniref:hypothetical protein n=1 Tax=Pseudochrobactrum algeriensis TaxID=2834768 RepID=UPI001BD1B7A0|nr:hypothetical protein [Pseudochrobactrum algeriensis]QVQ38078.1 hypothetical protein KHQ08_08870 [Pseudochrobactrum algeriensis]QVQ45225.1 hypothetical protein KHQ09_09130 [Pseudochrobactrum algeriensis]
MNIQNVSNQFAKDQDDRTPDSVFDFLYYDARRVGSFLSQFDDNGHMNGLTKSESIQQSTSDTATAEGEGSIPLIAKTKGSYVGNVSSSNSEAGTWSYDPFWVNALSFLDFLEQRGNLCRDLQQARMGSLALIPGRLFVRDLRLIQKIFGLQSLRSQFQPQEPKSNRKARRSHGVQSDESDASSPLGLELLGLLPHAIQAEVQSFDGTVWCSLNEADLVVDSSDLFLKHGVHVPGEWNILGIIDAIPSRNNDPVSAMGDYHSAQSGLKGNFGSLESLVANGFGGLIDGVVPMARMLLGRRDHQFGVTPLLIFRKAIG